jgi:hypothetical protein
MNNLDVVDEKICCSADDTEERRGLKRTNENR